MANKKFRSRKRQPVKKSRSRKRELVLISDNFVSRLVIAAGVTFLAGFAAMFAIYLQNDIIDIARGSGERATVQVAENGTRNNDSSQEPLSATVDIEISDADHFRGSKDAKITVVAFADFQCPFSLKLYNVMKRVMEDYPNEIMWAYKHFPLSSHKYARKAAEASECAGEQNKFWEFTDKLFENQAKINDDYVSSTVKEIGLNASRFEDCWSGGKYADKVDDDYNLGKEIGVTGSPGIVINGELINGALSYNEIKEKIEKYLTD